MRQCLLIVGIGIIFISGGCTGQEMLPPPGMPGQGMPPGGFGMPGMPGPELQQEYEPTPMDLLAAKPYRPAWAPLPIFRGDSGALTYLLSALKSDIPVQRARAAFILGQVGDKSALPDLKKLLLDKNPEVRFHAGVALGELGDGSGISAISKLFDTVQPWARCYGVHALWYLNTNYARNFLKQRRKNQHPMVSEIVGKALSTPWRKYPAVKPFSGKSSLPKVKIEEVWRQSNSVLLQESDYWWHKGNYNQLLRCQEAAVFIDPSDIETFSVMGWLYWSMGQDTTGIHAMNRAVANNPNSAEAYSELGMYYTRSKRWILAEQPLKKAVELGGGKLDRKAYAHCLEKTGKKDQAIDVWNQLKADYPDDPAIDLNYRRINGKRGEPV